MKGASPIEQGAWAPQGDPSWRVRAASIGDVTAVTAAVGELLRELGATPPTASTMRTAALELVEDPHAGELLVAVAAPPDVVVAGPPDVVVAASPDVTVGAHADVTVGAPTGDETLMTDAVEGEAILGVLGASWQSAIHVAGRYALIQDLWVHRAWRGSGVGGGLLAALFERARERGIGRVEVGLPRASFAGLEATEAFYRANGFTALGTRMRRSLP
jgi:GNAT superfamily N-acetyltransferase